MTQIYQRIDVSLLNGEQIYSIIEATRCFGGVMKSSFPLMLLLTTSFACRNASVKLDDDDGTVTDDTGIVDTDDVEDTGDTEDTDDTDTSDTDCHY